MPSRLVGHGALREQLEKRFRLQKLGQTLLFQGPAAIGKKLLALVHQYYESRQRRNQIPVSLNNFGSEKPAEIGRVLKNLRRWISWGKQIQQNVLNCEFPGKYD